MKKPDLGWALFSNKTFNIASSAIGEDGGHPYELTQEGFAL